MDKKFNELGNTERVKSNTFSSKKRPKRKKTTKDLKKPRRTKSSSGLVKSKNPSSSINLPKDNLSKVLVVDDTLFLLQLMENLFGQINIKIDTAISGEFAITKCLQRIHSNQEAYRLIVMDIQMPGGLNGVETTAEIRKHLEPYVKKIGQDNYKILAHTSMEEDQFEIDYGNSFRNMGFDGFVSKQSPDFALFKEWCREVDLL